MDTQFQSASQLIGDIFHLPIHILDSESDILQFSRNYMLHSTQDFLNPRNLKAFIENLHPGTIYGITDKFQIHFVLLLINNKPVMIGPFCALILTQHDCIKHLNQYHVNSLSSINLLAYRSRFPVISIGDVNHIAHSLIHLLDSSSKSYDTKAIDYCRESEASPLSNQDEALRKNYSELIQERYQIEQRFLHNVEAGDSHGAVLNLRSMQRDVAFLKVIGTTLENERIGAAIVRTLTRIAAMNAGLPATTIDLLSKNNTVAVFSAKTVEDIYKEKETMVLSFCKEINTHKKHRYSNLVLGIIYYIEHQYTHTFTINEMADELSVSANYLISTFHREVGMTPGNYIRQTRLKQAAQLLSSTDLTVQDISTMVGIPDANYFTKKFKQEYSMPPSQYRKYNRL